jgi:hypothetical protein
MLKFNEFITEKIHYDIDIDVNFLYSFFKEDIEEVMKTGEIRDGMFAKKIIYSSELKSNKCKEAHMLNPCYIHLNDYGGTSNGNYYRPKIFSHTSKSTISVKVSKSAIDFTNKYKNGSVIKATEEHPQIKLEFSPTRIKSSIRHELAHWLDDTMNNSHITKMLKDRTVRKKLKKAKHDNVNSLYFEIYAIIQNIYQLKLDNEDIWDDLSFEDMLYLNPSLSSIKKKMNNHDYNAWKKEVKRKMYKEDILGKNMR